ncbi:hypothetical protein ACFV5N_23435 [Streptomyces sp. NPDC059853]|uniref:hypothetical protein n=1 Tax=Streptomyces sp. NPDC059853 TaxID=3346973 RepID=UPI00364EE56A
MTETRPTPPPPALARLLAIAARELATALRAHHGTVYDDRGARTARGVLLAADHLDAHADQLDQPADPDEHEAPGWRHVLTEDEYDRAFLAGLSAPLTAIGSATVELVLGAGLARLGILPPPPDPEPGACTEQWATPYGYWAQCAEDPGHDPADGHDDGEWSWPHPDADAPIPYALTPAATTLTTGD